MGVKRGGGRHDGSDTTAVLPVRHGCGCCGGASGRGAARLIAGPGWPGFRHADRLPAQGSTCSRCRYRARGSWSRLRVARTRIVYAERRSCASCIRSCRRRRCGRMTMVRGWEVSSVRSGWRLWRTAAHRFHGAVTRMHSPRDLPGLAPGRYVADAVGQRGAADDALARRVRRGEQ